MVASLKSSSNYKKSLHFKNIHRYSSTGVIISEKTEAVSTFNNINVLNNTKTSTEPATPIAADNNVTIDEALLPPAPSIPVDTLNENVVSSVSGVLESGLTEPSLASLGLASWWPPGILQRLLEILHINFDLPWWGSIAIGKHIFYNVHY